VEEGERKEGEGGGGEVENCKGFFVNKHTTTRKRGEEKRRQRKRGEEGMMFTSP